MSTYKFSPAERAAIFSVHGEKCYLCGGALTLKTMEVDHIIPEALLSDPKQLSIVLIALGRAANFQINSFENWLPACGSCNNAKSNTIFEQSPLVQLQLQRAAAKAPQVATIAGETLHQRKIWNALNVLERAEIDGKLDNETIEVLASFIARHRPAELASQPILLSPFYEVLSEKDGVLIVKGPYGVGARPIANNAHSTFNCPNCGSIGAWNGPRCVICGNLDED